MAKKKMLKNLALTTLSLFLSLLITEIVLRVRSNLFAPVDIQWLKDHNADDLIARVQNDPLRIRFFNGCLMDSGIMQKDDDLGWRNIPSVRGYTVRVYGRPNLVVSETFDFSQIHAKGLRTETAPFRINNLGNRGPDMAEEKPTNTIRIVFIGDSITFGYYVNEEDTFSVRVGKALGSTVPPGKELEVVNAGVSSLNATNVLAHLRQRALSWSPDAVIWSFYVNDVRDTAGRETDILFPVRKSGWLRNCRASALVRKIEQAIQSTRVGSQLNIDPENPVNVAVNNDWARVDTCLAEAVDILKERDIPLIIAVFPSAIQFGRPWTTPHYQEKIKALCKRRQIPFIDLLPAIEAVGPADTMYYSGDLVHPNARGHAAAADAIVSFLKSHPYIGNAEHICMNKGVNSSFL